MMRKRDESTVTASEHQHIDTLIGAHSSFKGELAFEGAVRIDGRFEGNMRSTKDGTLIISQGAEISGEVHVPNLILHGMIKGNVHASRNLKVGETGCINGDVEYKRCSYGRNLHSDLISCLCIRKRGLRMYQFTSIQN